jgi:hypothetical protein
MTRTRLASDDRVEQRRSAAGRRSLRATEPARRRLGDHRAFSNVPRTSPVVAATGSCNSGISFCCVRHLGRPTHDLTGAERAQAVGGTAARIYGLEKS